MKEAPSGTKGAGGGESTKHVAEGQVAAVSDVLAAERRQGGVFVHGDMYVYGTVAGNDVKGNRGSGEFRRIVSVVAFLPEDLHRLEVVCVDSDLAPKARKILDEYRFVFLQGPSGVGKATAGLSLLGFDKEILSVDPSLTVRDLGDFKSRFPYGKNRRYIVEALSPASATQLTKFVARAVTRDLLEQDCYLVFTLDDEVQLSTDLSDYTVAWHQAPPVDVVLRRHIAFYLKDAAISAIEERYDLDEVCEKLAGRSVRQVDEVACALAQAFAEGDQLEAVLSRLGLDAPAQVDGWFNNNPTVEQIAFIIAVAVLGGCTYTTVANHARRLEKLIAQGSRIKLSNSPLDTLRVRSDRVRDSMAVLETGIVETEFGFSPAQTVRLESRWHVQAVLDQLWSNYDIILEAVIRWLFEAGHDPDPGVRLRAAAAVGYLSQYDFAMVRNRVLLPWALGTTNPARAAADALGQAARSETTAPLALALLDVWAADERYDLWWTAAVAYGGEVGVAFPSVAMDRLVQILNFGDALAPPIVVDSAIRLIQSGGRFAEDVADHVLKELTFWLDYTPLSSYTARWCYAHLLRLASDQDIALSLRFRKVVIRPTHRQESARMLRACLSEKTFRSTVLESIQVLVRATDNDEETRQALGDLLIETALSRSAVSDDRERLLHFLNRWATGPVPSTAAQFIADRLQKATTL